MTKYLKPGDLVRITKNSFIYQFFSILKPRLKSYFGLLIKIDKEDYIVFIDDEMVICSLEDLEQF